MTTKKILFAGVPFGRDNVGDEAILECAVNIVRQVTPSAQITVSTHTPEQTAKKLNLRCVPLFGFDTAFDAADLRKEIRSHDTFFWPGATGLSDYPEIPLNMLKTAQQAGKKTIVWNVGMNTHLNPVKYTVLPGRRRDLLQRISLCTGNRFDAVAAEEHRRDHRVRRLLSTVLNRADLVVSRDAPSKEQILSYGGPEHVIVGADSALRLSPLPLHKIPLSPAARRLIEGPSQTVGLCISAQRPIADRSELIHFINALTQTPSRSILFVPMNPITDAKLMRELIDHMHHPERAALIEGTYEPDQIAGIAGELDVVISSRLHLLILASISNVPIIGVGRGSKINSFLQPYGLTPAGTVEHCNFESLHRETLRMLNERSSFDPVSRQVQSYMQSRLHQAIDQLAEVL
jgi:polysaccharide pyruvyl transferase WcaK-like protein